MQRRGGCDQFRPTLGSNSTTASIDERPAIEKGVAYASSSRPFGPQPIAGCHPAQPGRPLSPLPTMRRSLTTRALAPSLTNANGSRSLSAHPSRRTRRPRSRRRDRPPRAYSHQNETTVKTSAGVRSRPGGSRRPINPLSATRTPATLIGSAAPTPDGQVMSASQAPGRPPPRLHYVRAPPPVIRQLPRGSRRAEARVDAGSEIAGVSPETTRRSRSTRAHPARLRCVYWRPHPTSAASVLRSSRRPKPRDQTGRITVAGQARGDRQDRRYSASEGSW